MITTLHGDCRERLADLPERSIQCVVTSPPYYGLRRYTDDPREIGQEATPAAYVAALVEVFRGVRRVLRDDGVVWLNLGDSYAGTGKSGGGVQGERWQDHGHQVVGPRGGHWAPPPDGLKEKDLMGIPWRVAFALQDDGWYLRSDVIWSKPNCMPESVTDRPTRAHEYVFLLTKSARYFYDAAAVAEPAIATENRGGNKKAQHLVKGPGAYGDGFKDRWQPSGTRNRRTVWEIPDPADERAAFGMYLANLAQRLMDAGIDSATIGAAMRQAEADNLAAYADRSTVWTIATQPYSGAHYATMPEALIEPCILAGSSARACEHCGAAWVRVVERGMPSPDSDRPQQRRAAQLWIEKGLTDEHLVALRAVGMADTGKAQHTMTGYGKNTPEAQRLADEAKAALGGYLREFLTGTASTTGFAPGCACPDNTGSAASAVLDPFGGSGTVGCVALRLQRRAVLIELNQAYIDEHIEKRTNGAQIEMFV